MVVWLRRLAWCVIGLMLLWIFAWLALPPLLEWQIPVQGSKALGRAVTVGAVRFKPWTLEITLADFAVAGATAGSEPLLQVKQLHADLSISSLFRLAPIVEALEIDAPQLRVARTSEGHYDIDDLIKRFSSSDAPPAQPSKPVRFALYNLQVRDAQLRFDDGPVKHIHQIEALRLALPFISNLPAEVEIKVEPRLAFRLNGTQFDTGAQATPFAKNDNGEMKLAMGDLDLTPYLGYLPETLPIRVTRGSVSADMTLQFAVSAGAAPSVTLKGTLGAKDVAMTDAAGHPLAAWQRLQLGLSDVQPLARKVALQTLQVEGLQLNATRDDSGQINLLQLSAANAQTASDKGAAAKEPMPESSAASGARASANAPTPWQVSLEALNLDDARILWSDAAVKPAAALQLDDLKISAKQVHWPITASIPVTLSGALHAQAAGTPVLAQFTAEGPVTDREAKLSVKVTALSLGALAPYLAQTLVPSIDGQVAAQAQVDWSGSAEEPRLQVALDRVTLDDLKLSEGSGQGVVQALTLKQLGLADVKVDLLGHSVALGSVKLVGPSLVLSRDKAGRLSAQDWVAPDNTPAPAQSGRVAQSAAAPSPWRIGLKDLQLDDGELRFADASVHRGARKEPLRVMLNDLHVAVKDLDWQGGHAAAPANMQLSARLGAPQRGKAKLGAVLEYKGHVGVQPLMASGTLRVERFPVHLFTPYFADQIPLALLHADAGYSGNVSAHQQSDGLEVSTRGDVLLGDVHVASLPDPQAGPDAPNNDELLSWQSLALKGVTVAIKPKGRPQVEIGSVALTDFYSRLIVTEQGRFNLQEVGAPPSAERAASGANAAPDTHASVRPAASPAALAPQAAASAGLAADTGAGLPLDIKVGTTTLTNGRVDFTDHFVRPNYSAALTELNGQLGAFNSNSREMASLTLRGKAEGSALLEISGELNPTAKPLALDIHAKATDLELAPLSPYAGKYAGYAIERGKLSMDVTYKIDADGKLDAKNQVVLNQLTFGEKIESKDAIKLPILLAVALLKDRNGVIDINLPVSGSVNDPKFSVGGIILKVIINLIAKALTAPFALLSGGGSDDLSQVDFQPGTATIAPTGAAAIDKVAKALTERPALKMTVTGAADPVSERDAVQSAAIETRVLAQQRRERLAADAPDAASSAAPALSADEHTRLLKQLYKETDIPNKPRNAIGFVKDIPPAEMEALLKTRMPVTADAARELALQRGLAVRDALIAKGLPSERLFLAAPQVRAAGADDAAWTPRVQLSLSVN
jgi:hypothetical protein